MITCVALFGAASLEAPATAQDGGALFKQRCQGCHASIAGQPSGIGPNLAGVYGRKAANTDYAYSPALKASALKWDTATLDKYLAGPGALVPGTKMPIAIFDPAQRAAIIAYLATLGKARWRRSGTAGGKAALLLYPCWIGCDYSHSRV